nr:hypothetical protein [uncultured bacterium]
MNSGRKCRSCGLAPHVNTMGHGCGPYACGPGYSGRRYLTKDEKAAWLKDYADDLENELKAVRERIAEIAA